MRQSFGAGSLFGGGRLSERSKMVRDEGKLLRASLYPPTDFLGRRARLRALAAAEKEFDAVIQSFVGVAASKDVVT